MRRMGIEALYRKPNTSRRRPGSVYPYLLRGLEVSRPNQVWAMDITYIPMARYLAAVGLAFDSDRRAVSLGRHGAPSPTPVTTW